MQTSNPPRARLDPSTAALWASAFVIGAMLTIQAGRLGAPEAASAGNLAEVGQVRLLTAAAGDGEELLAVLNMTDETISIYGVENQRSFDLYQVANLPDLFEQSKSATGSKR